jgi:hypothetical protein
LKKNPHRSDEDQNSEPSEPPDDNKQLNNKQLNNKQLNNKQLNKCETIEDGTEAFMQWMGSSDKKSLKSDNPIVLIKFINDVLTVLYDTSLSKKVEVKLSSGIPYCNYCKSDDCAHVGFTICVEQLGRHRRDGKEETIEEIVNS